MATSSNEPTPPDAAPPAAVPPDAAPPGPVEELHRLNFENPGGILHILPVPDVYHYELPVYTSNGYRHLPIKCYCVDCEEKSTPEHRLNVSPTHPTFRLQTISHGTHSSDFFRAMGDARPADLQDWHQEPVMFVFESPGYRHSFYSEVQCGNYHKWPTMEWYWVHHPFQIPTPPTGCPSTGYPQFFRRRLYGPFVLGVMLTFRLANVYVTNLVKCGLNNDAGRSKPLADFHSGCVENCYRRYLQRELDIFKPRIIFAVGAAGASRLGTLAENTWPIQPLPHPAAHNLPGVHRQVLNFWLVLNGLRAVSIVSLTEYASLAEQFYACFGPDPGGVAMPPP